MRPRHVAAFCCTLLPPREQRTANSRRLPLPRPAQPRRPHLLASSFPRAQGSCLARERGLHSSRGRFRCPIGPGLAVSLQNICPSVNRSLFSPSSQQPGQSHLHQPISPPTLSGLVATHPTPLVNPFHLPGGSPPQPSNCFRSPLPVYQDSKFPQLLYTLDLLVFVNPQTSATMSAPIDSATAQLANTSLDNTAPTTESTGAQQPTAAEDEAVRASAAEGRRLYIGNLAYATTEGELKDFFKDYLVYVLPSLPV